MMGGQYLGYGEELGKASNGRGREVGIKAQYCLGTYPAVQRPGSRNESGVLTRRGANHVIQDVHFREAIIVAMSKKTI
jgi:hypothetical protein